MWSTRWVRVWVGIALVAFASASAWSQSATLNTSELFDTGVNASVTDANGTSYLVAGNKLLTVSAAGTLISSRTFTGVTFNAVAVDATGNVYAAGDANCAVGCSTAPLVFVNGTAPSPAAGAGVVKLNADGSLGYFDVFATSGGTNDASPSGVAVDPSGAAYITGTSSCGFPTTAGSLHPACAGGKLGFVAKIATSGQNLVYATYLDGAAGGTTPADVTADAQGNAYVTGGTTAADFPTTAGAFLTANPGGTNGFVSKLNNSGAALVYSTLFAKGSGTAIAIDSASPPNAFISGSTGGGITTTANAAAPTFAADGASSVAQFAARFDGTGSTLVYSTYLGIAQRTAFQGTGTNFLNTHNAIAVDGAGDAYIVGTTNHSGGPAVNPIQSGLGDAAFFPGLFSGDGFVVELNPAGSQYLMSTYLGGRDGDSATGIGVTGDNSVFVSGITFTNQFPALLQATGSSSAVSGFYVKISPTGSGIPILFPGDRPPFGSVAAVGELDFGTAQSGNAITKRFHLGNYGGSTINVASVTTGTSEFVANSSCPGSLAPGAGCDITVIFTPGGPGARADNLVANTNAAGGLTSNRLTATVIAPGVLLSSRTLTFGVVSIGATSSPQAVTVTNSGGTQLQVTSVTASSGYNVASNGCTGPIAPLASCQVTVTFTPGATGEIDGTLTINDTAFGSPHTVNLIGGITPDFTLTVPSTGITTSTTAAGSPAVFTLTIAPTGGFQGNVTFGCTGNPDSSTCAIAPTNVSLNGTGSATVTITIATTARTTAALHGPSQTFAASMSAGSLGAITVTCLLLLLIARRRKRLIATMPTLFVLALFSLGLITGCGGKSSTPTTTTGTPAGTSTITITATSGVTSHTQTFTLVVT